MPAELHLLRPQWLLALLPLLALLVLLWRRAQDQAWRPLVDPHLLPHLLVGSQGSARRLPLALLALGWLIAVLALAGPVWERLPAPVFALDAKRVILLDLSPSMNAADVPPSRLARARFEVLDLLGASQEGQVAVVAYGPEPFVVSPLTGDAQTIADQVPRLASDLIPVPGPRRTDRALAAAGDLLAAAGGGPGEVILISDGVAGTPGEGAGSRAGAEAAARALVQAGHRLSVLALGTDEGAPVAGYAGGFASGDGGASGLSRLDRQGLGALARAGGGRYVELAAGDEDTRALLAEGLPLRSQVVEQEGLSSDQWREEGPWLLLALLPLAGLAFRRGWLLPAVLLAAMLPPNPGWALDWADLWQRADQRAAAAFEAGDLGVATRVFQDPAWRAAARYRAGDYGGALDDLDGRVGPESDYNRGNALARLGRVDDAIAAYERALEQAPEMDDARANLELLRRLRERQEQRQPSDPQDQGQAQQSQQGDQGEQSQPSQQGDQGEQSQPSQQGDQGEQSQPSQGDQGQPPDQGAGQTGESPGDGQQGPRDPSQSPGDGRASAEDVGEGTPGQGAPPETAEQAKGGSTGADWDPGSEPRAGDLGQDAVADEPQADFGSPEQRQGETKSGPAGEAEGFAAAGSEPAPRERERRQALEAQLRRVPDDPAGLLRQRFILQHLRREGRLP